MITSDFKIVPEYSDSTALCLAVSPGNSWPVTYVHGVRENYYALLDIVRRACLGGNLLEICYPLNGCNTASWPATHDTRTINAGDLYFTRARNWIVKGSRTDSGDARAYRLDYVAYVRRIESTTGNVVETWGDDPKTGNPV